MAGIRGDQTLRGEWPGRGRGTGHGGTGEKRGARQGGGEGMGHGWAGPLQNSFNGVAVSVIGDL